MPIPLQLWSHIYFVTEHASKLNRIEFLGYEKEHHPSRVYERIFKNYLPPEMGFRIMSTAIFWDIGPRFGVKLIKEVAGGVSSPAHKLWDLLENGGFKNYPFMNQYNMVLGPNSNTFTQWVIDQVPECGLKLPWNAWGKGYKE